MAKSKRLQALSRLASDVERLCDAAGADRFMYELKLHAESEERRHRATGKRLAGATYAGSVADAVNYFVCKTVLEPMPVPRSWRDYGAIRRDYQLGQACRECILGASDKLPPLEALWTELAFEYGEDIVR